METSNVVETTHSVRSLCYDGYGGEMHGTPALPLTSERPSTDRRRRVDFWRERFKYASSFVPLVMDCLRDHGVDALPQVRFLVEDALSGVVFYPPTSPLFVPVAGRGGGVFVHMTTESLLNATSFLAFDEDSLRAEFETIKRSRNLAVLMVLVELHTMLHDYNADADDPMPRSSLHADYVVLLEQSVRFLVTVLTAEPHGNTRRKLSFTFGSRLTASDGVLSLQVAFEPTPELARMVGYTEFSQLMSSGVQHCRMCEQWSSQDPFYSADDILKMVSERRRNAPTQMRSVGSISIDGPDSTSHWAVQ